MKRNYATMHVRKRIASILICVLLLGLVAICIGIPIRGVNAADTTYSDKIIALTFDDGPAEYTNRILDTLSENNCKATFFVIGRQINSHAQTLIRASSQGCEILGHSWDHEHLETLTANELRQNLQDTNNAIFNLLGTQPKMYRPPYGETGGNIISVSKEMDLAIIKWSVDPKDWEHKNADMTYDGIMNYVTNGSIILCHDIVSTTADAMEQIIPELVSRGYTLTTVSELLGKTEAGNIYTGSTEIPIPLYTVQPGDTLPLIAEKCGTTVYTIKILNNLTSDTIYPGQQLQLRYMIRLGDNLWLISKTYGTTVDDIKALNNLTSDTIYPGQQLQIPQPQPPADPFNPESNTYTVQSGDSLWLISKTFGTTVDAIKTLNNLTSDMIYPGQQLQIPQPQPPADPFNPETNIYTVQSGDSLWLISKTFGTTVDDIKALNNLTSDTIYPGQQLQIPQPQPPADPESNTYTVQSGDSLWLISKTFGTTVDAIKTLNNLTSDMIYPGQQLQIPS